VRDLGFLGKIFGKKEIERKRPCYSLDIAWEGKDPIVALNIYCCKDPRAIQMYNLKKRKLIDGSVWGELGWRKAVLEKYCGKCKYYK
jgi:hypothetical protein